MRVVGVDGCPGGWLAAVLDATEPKVTLRVHTTFRELLCRYPDASCVAVDIPIGLARGEAREADLEARKVLGARRGSVFPAPDPRLLDALAEKAIGYAEANAFSRSILNKGISRQAFAIFPKIAEVNSVMTPGLQERVVEVHPEVCFWALAGHRPMEHHKGKKEGYAERHELLTEAFRGIDIPVRRTADRIAPPARADDVLDALVAAWTARRFAAGKADRLPVVPLVDARGLRMEMVY